MTMSVLSYIAVDILYMYKYMYVNVAIIITEYMYMYMDMDGMSGIYRGHLHLHTTGEGFFLRPTRVNMHYNVVCKVAV